MVPEMFNPSGEPSHYVVPPLLVKIVPPSSR